MIFKYANKQTKRRPFMTILILFQFAAITVLISLIITKLQSYFVASNLIKEVCTENSYKIEYDISYHVENEDRLSEISDKQYEEMQPYVNKLDNGEITQEEYDKVFSKIDEKYNKIIEEENLLECNKPIDLSQLPYVQKKYIYYHSNLVYNDDLELYLLSKDYCNDLNFKMQEGCWFSEAKETDDYINAVTFSSSGYKVGDVFDISLYGGSSEDDTVDTNNNLKVKIVGLIDYSYYKQIIEHGKFETNDFVSIDDFFPVIDSDTLLVEYSSDFLNKLPKYKGMYIEPNTQVVKLKDDITEKEKKEFFSVATSKKYQCTNLNEAYENTYIRDKKEFQNDIIFLIIASLIAIISLVGMSALSVSKEIKTYSIYCLNGMTRKQCIKINTVYICILVLISTIIAFIVELMYAFFNYYKAYMDISFYVRKPLQKKQFCSADIFQ